MFRSIRSFHSTIPRLVKVGDSIPSVALAFQSPGNSIDLSKELASGKSVVIGVPGAFSPGCTQSHLPGYFSKIKDFEAKGYEKFIVVSVNDAFVMNSWSETFGDLPKVKFVADASGEFVSALDLKFDASKFFGNERAKRFALLVEDGVVKGSFVEPDNTSVDVSAADKVLPEA